MTQLQELKHKLTVLLNQRAMMNALFLLTQYGYREELEERILTTGREIIELERLITIEEAGT